MTKRKMKIMSSKAMRIIPTSVMPSKVSELVRNLVEDIDVLGRYHEDSDQIIRKDLDLEVISYHCKSVPNELLYIYKLKTLSRL